MFERYDDTARRVIFYARMAAQRFGAERIEPEQVLWGLLHEADSLFQRLAIDSAVTKGVLEAQLG